MRTISETPCAAETLPFSTSRMSAKGGRFKMPIKYSCEICGREIKVKEGDQPVRFYASTAKCFGHIYTNFDDGAGWSNKLWTLQVWAHESCLKEKITAIEELFKQDLK